MSHEDIIRAWKDEEYWSSLSDEQQAQLLENSAGITELSNQAMQHIGSGLFKTKVACRHNTAQVNMLTNITRTVKSHLTLLAFLLGSTLFSSTVLKTDTATAQSIPPTFTTSIDSRQTFIHADISARDSVPINLKQLGINPGDTILLERFGYFSPFGDPNNEYTGSITATFSTDNRLLPNNGSFNGNTTDRVPGAIDAQFPNGCSQFQCINKLFFISRGQNLVQGGVNGIIVRVPASAQYLFIGAADSRYGDNVDSNKDLAVGISKVLAP